MNFFRFFRRQPPTPRAVPITPAQRPAAHPVASASLTTNVQRYFHNEASFQCYTSWFPHWDGWITAGHCLTEAQDTLPPFARGKAITWPDGLDAAVIGCALPDARPLAPHIGMDVIITGYPAGSRNAEQRTARIYHERSPGQWIAHILLPDEPVVTGMSGGPVTNAATGEVVGITITRNSPADLNNDRDPDESADFISLAAVWDALRTGRGNV